MRRGKDEMFYFGVFNDPQFISEIEKLNLNVDNIEDLWIFFRFYVVVLCYTKPFKRMI